MQSLASSLKISRQIDATAAGVTAVNGAGVDMQGFDGVLFICHIGTLTAGQATSLKAQTDTAAGFGTAADTAGSGQSYADADSGKVIVLDVYRPAKRYVRPVVLRATQNAVINSVVAIQYKGGKLPLATALIDATQKSLKTLVSPADGTP